MPKLIKAGYNPIPVAGVIGRRETAPDDVVGEWKNNPFFTGDGVMYDGRKNAKLVLDAKLLREISPETRLDNSAAVLSVDQWEDQYGDSVLYLSADKVAQAHKKGFVKRNGVWQPENTVVGDVWNHLSRGKDLKDYAGMVHKASGSNRVMWLWFDKNTYFSPVLRSLVVSRIDYDSHVLGSNNLNNNNGRLVGVAPELSAGKSRTERSEVTGAHVGARKRQSL
ncbi:MAG: hypothetical protein KKA62_01710 [Nanoarchaeota archaeon]|nr:hypothetical protein [Nanoarchaeota archaeon]MBU1976649.1 hypothetical protein [Nanoarchaeota archaeon]